jgi:hypothetical protein
LGTQTLFVHVRPSAQAPLQQGSLGPPHFLQLLPASPAMHAVPGATHWEFPQQIWLTLPQPPHEAFTHE